MQNRSIVAMLSFVFLVLAGGGSLGYASPLEEDSTIVVQTEGKGLVCLSIPVEGVGSLRWYPLGDFNDYQVDPVSNSLYLAATRDVDILLIFTTEADKRIVIYTYKIRIIAPEPPPEPQPDPKPEPQPDPEPEPSPEPQPEPEPEPSPEFGGDNKYGLGEVSWNACRGFDKQKRQKCADFIKSTSDRLVGVGGRPLFINQDLFDYMAVNAGGDWITPIIKKMKTYENEPLKLSEWQAIFKESEQGILWNE
jgi:hypothetical protein